MDKRIKQTPIRLEKKALYKCDPNKNRFCNKRGCKYNNDSVYPICELTTRIECSTDGIPVETGQYM